MDTETIIYLKRIAEALEQIVRQMSADKCYPAQTPPSTTQEAKNNVPTPDAGGNGAPVPISISTDTEATKTTTDSSEAVCYRIAEQSPQEVIGRRIEQDLLAENNR